MSKYDKTIAISHEEEGTYHRREVDCPPYTSTSKPVTSHHTERYLVEDDRPRGKAHKSSKLLSKSGNYTSDDDEKDNFEEWTTSKRKVNHKTRQVETRVSRQLLVENGKVIADSGPQVTTRIKEDNKLEECEKEKTPKNKGKFEALSAAPEGPEGCVSGRVLGEKKEIQRVSREVREENMQYHDERFKELTGRDVHQKAIRAPHELITINDKHHAAESAPRGKMVHYSNRGKKYQDTDEILEVAKLAIDGSVTKEVKRTHNHEEFSEDEKPDETGEAEELRHKPVVQRSSRRHVDYVNDYDDVRTPEASDNDEREVYDSRTGHSSSTAARRHKPLTSGTGGRRSGGRRHHDSSDEAFPRYELDPLLNSLRDEDYRPASASSNLGGGGGGRVKEVALQRRADRGPSSSSSSSDEEQGHRRSRNRAHQARPASGASGRVEIPEVYRVNKQRLLAGKSSSRERSCSPDEHQQRQHRVVHTTTTKQTSRPGGDGRRDGRNRQREDAATQARLTDEEIERQSVRSSLSGAGAGQHAKTAKHLERQSTPNASRRYYFGNAATANEAHRGKGVAGGKRRCSVTSSASSVSSLDDPKSRARQQGVRSRDSGFRSPHQREPDSPDPKQQQIYSVSSKSARAGAKTGRGHQREGATSPTLTQGSAGQRSVKTTTTTLSAGLADRPESRGGRASRNSDKKDAKRKFTRRAPRTETDGDDEQTDGFEDERARSPSEQRRAERSFDTVSVSSLKGPNATKIKVPYRHVIEIQQAPVGQQEVSSKKHSKPCPQVKASGRKQNDAELDNVSAVAVEKSSSEMSFQEDIESLSKRLANISEPLAASQAEQADEGKQYFDYKTVVANVHSSQQPKRTVNSYNVTLEQNSPFHTRPSEDTTGGRSRESPATGSLDNNNDTNFDLSDYYVKYRATPALVDDSALLTGKPNQTRAAGREPEDDEDRMSQVSSRTYKIRTIGSTSQVNQDQKGNQNQEDGGDEDQAQGQERQPEETIEFDESGNSRRPAAWIFDPRDGSSTAIVPPKRPETPKVDSKTEELVQARGGRSYYLELVENPNGKPHAKRQRPSSIDSLYSRWNSQGAINTSFQPATTPATSTAATTSVAPCRPLAAIQLKSPSGQHRSTKQINSTIAQQEQDRAKTPSGYRRQLPFSGPPLSLSDKSKSSSCLLSVTKPSKYSIYGGFRRPGETSKPVPRLSYSRAIGPRSQRIDGQPKTTPSRYLKMR